MIERIEPFKYAGEIVRAMNPGILLNTNDQKFNSMVIGWGQLGVLWSRPVFTVYVRESRYTKGALDRTGEFSVSAPFGAGADKTILRVFGTQSGRDVDKADCVTLVPGQTVNVPAVREFPLTLECKVLYRREQDPALIPEEVLAGHYRGGDYHTAYIGLITDAYLLK